MCFEGVEVKKKLGLHLSFDLRWKTFAAFASVEIIYRRKVTKTKRRKPFHPLKLQMALGQLCKNTFAYDI